MNVHFTKLPKMLVQSQHETKKAQFQRICILLSVHPGNSSIHLDIRGYYFFSGLSRTVPIYIQSPGLIINSTSFHFQKVLEFG